MKVRVTKVDIKRGRDNLHTTCGCPIWYALHRQLGIPVPVNHSDSPIRIPQYDKISISELDLRLPPAAQRWQRDNKDKLKPFTFEITEVF